MAAVLTQVQVQPKPPTQVMKHTSHCYTLLMQAKVQQTALDMIAALGWREVVALGGSRPVGAAAARQEAAAAGRVAPQRNQGLGQGLQQGNSYRSPSSGLRWAVPLLPLQPRQV